MMRRVESWLRRLRIDPNRSSWTAMLLASVLTIYAQAALLRDFSPTSTMVELRLAHMVLAAVIFIVTIAKRETWNRRIGGFLYAALALPLYFISGIYHVEAARAGQAWVAFAGFKLYFLAISVLIAGPYWLNVLLMAGFAVETMVLWFYLQLGPLESAVTIGEPMTTTLYAIVSISLLAFRVYHEHLARELAAVQARAETMEQVARIFLTLRDKTNTPIQTLEAAAELLRRRHPEEDRLADVIRRASERLSDTGTLLARLESQVSWSGEELMSDEEIRRWLDQMEQSERDGVRQQVENAEKRLSGS